MENNPQVSDLNFLFDKLKSINIVLMNSNISIAHSLYQQNKAELVKRDLSFRFR